MLSGVEDCNANLTPDECEIGAPTVVFEETFSRGGLLASYWPVAEGEIEINSFGGFPYDFVLFLIEENLLESAEMDLSGAFGATLQMEIGPEGDNGTMDIDFWDGNRWRLLRTESLVNFVPGTLANPRVIDLPSDALHSAFKIRIHGPQSQYRWRLDDIVVSRIDDDCNGNGRIDTCDASEAAHDCNNNAALDVCDIDQARVGHRQDYDLGVWPDSIALGDFDNDGDNDLAVGRGPFYSGGYVRLMINDGFGMFQVAEELAAGVWPRAIVAGDIDNDADIDLVAAAGNLQLLRNYGGIWWGFAPGVGLATPGIDLVAQDVALGDVDQDGDLDLVATFGTLGAGSPQFAVLLNDGAGQFTLVHSYELPGEAARSVVLFDADHDGDLDAAATIQLYSDGVIVLPNLGSAPLGQWRGFGERMPFAASAFGGAQSFHVAAGDMDRDGFVDLAVANPMGSMDGATGSIGVLRNAGANSGGWLGFKPLHEIGVDLGPTAVALGDLNGDGWLDAATALSERSKLGVLINRRSDLDGEWLGFMPQPDRAVTGYPMDVALGDVSGDGPLDVIVANRAANSVGGSSGVPRVSVFHIQTGADADCNTNSVPDSCESVGDCDGDGVGDGCELDCNRNEVPDDCELAGGAADCNDNGTPDDCDVATGRSRDCDADGVPDECTSEHEFSARSPLMTPIYYALPQEWIVRTPPTPASDVVIDVTLQVGLTATEYVDVLLNGTLLSHFATSTDGACPQPPRGRPPHLIHIGLTAAEFQTLLVGGDAVFSITTNWDAGCYGPSPPARSSLSYARIDVRYSVAGGLDCDRTGQPDSCDLADGTSLDLDGSGVLDECEGFGDADLDGIRGSMDASLLAACVLGPGGPLAEKCGAFDYNRDGDVDLGDLQGFWLTFGR